jgi:transcriptional regulator with XRE-family HTH domain
MRKQKPAGSDRLAARLKQLRGGLTQQQAGERAGINGNTWQNLERSMVKPQPITLQRIANGFGVEYAELWSYVDDQPLVERFSDEELDRLAMRLAPLIAQHLRSQDQSLQQCGSGARARVQLAGR